MGKADLAVKSVQASKLGIHKAGERHLTIRGDIIQFSLQRDNSGVPVTDRFQGQEAEDMR